MNKKKPLNELHDELRTLLLSCGKEGDTPAARAGAYLESARQSLDCFGDAEAAAEDAREALRLAQEGGIDLRKYRSMYFRALFRAGAFGDIVRAVDEANLVDAESLLWRSMALFCMKGDFPFLKSADIPDIEHETLLEYAFLAYEHGFTRQARMAAANAHAFLLDERRERLMAECYFDEGAYLKTVRLYKTLALRDRSHGALFVRYADAMAMANKFGAAREFLRKNPPADASLAALLAFNLSSLDNDAAGMQRALAQLGLVQKGILYWQKRASYFRIRGAINEARRSLTKARAFLPKSLDPPPHERAIALALDCEEVLLEGNAAKADSLLPHISALPVTEGLLYKKALTALERSADIPDDGGVPFNPLTSPWLKAVIALMMGLIVFLIYLETKFRWLRP